MTLEFRVGDAFERLAEIPDGSIDLVVIGIDLDHRNADLARDRVGMFLDIVGAA